MALTPLESAALNTKLPSTPPQDDVTWHDPPSSPFIDNIDQENVLPSVHSANDQLLLESSLARDSPLFKKMTSPKDSTSKLQQSRTDDQMVARSRSSGGLASPAKRISVEASIGHGVDFGPLAEDQINDNITEATPRPTLKSLSPVKSTPSYKRSAPLSPVKYSESQSSNEHILRDNEGLTIAMRIMEDEDMKLIPNDNFDDTLDDTCYSAFSEIPNTDMTAFARLGQRSPTKFGAMDEVCGFAPSLVVSC
jgi:hypothetical protein